MKAEIIIVLCVCLFVGFESYAGTKLVPVDSERFITNLKYNTEDNFLKKNVYREFNLTGCYLHQDLAQKIHSLETILSQKKLKLIFFDCFRPLAVQQAMWKIVPDARYVANPKSGSNHNRGVAVDLTLADEQGVPLPMPSEFDDFSSKAAVKYACSTVDQQKCDNRDLLIRIMASVGLNPIATEWWHFQHSQAASYPLIQDMPND